MLTRREAIELVVREDPYYQLEPAEIHGVPWRIYQAAVGSLRAILESTTAFRDRDFLVY
jgi:hypothetical protein